jgi:succinate dehydrogenase / fumarate reductase cytochrome b subunit
VNNNRPKNLNLLTIHFPLPAIISILHRISGVLLVLLIPLFIWGLHLSLKSMADFDQLQQLFAEPYMRFIVWVALSGLCYHLVAGIRHLLMDVSVGDGLKSGRIGSITTLLVAGLLIILVGVWLW